MMSEILQKLQEIEQRFDKKTAADFDVESLRVEFLGKKSELTEIFKSMKDLSRDEKPVVGKAASDLKKKIEHMLHGAAQNEERLKDFFDVTAPSKRKKIGHIHPFTQLKDDVSHIFSSMGFDVIEGTHITTDFFNFESLNIPKGHPARDAWDTFYLSQDGGEEGEKLLLRPHTSSMQVPFMRNNTPPIRTVVIGRCFRNEATDATHEHSFNQIEGFVVDENVSVTQLVYTLEEALSAIFNADITVRLRPGFFPFVEPGYELDFQCLHCSGKGCRVCKNTGWVEFLGCGMIHPKVFEAAGYEKRKYTGFAFGMGFDRIAMMRYGVPEIRLFNSGDLRFIRQF